MKSKISQGLFGFTAIVGSTLATTSSNTVRNCNGICVTCSGITCIAGAIYGVWLIILYCLQRYNYHSKIIR